MTDGPLRTGVAGADGFLGSSLVHFLANDSCFQIVPWNRSFLSSAEKFREFARKCSAIVDFAGLSRHEDGEYLYKVNLELAGVIADACAAQEKPPVIYFASTTHDAKQTPYHASKRDSVARLRESGARVVVLRIPNAFGPGGKPFYNSVVATFCRLAVEGRTPERVEDVLLHLISSRTLCAALRGVLLNPDSPEVVTFPDEFEIRLPELWNVLTRLLAGRAPENELERRLAETLDAERKRK